MEKPTIHTDNDAPISWFATQVFADGRSPMVSRTYVGARLQQLASGEISPEEARAYIAAYDPALHVFAEAATSEIHRRRSRANRLVKSVEFAVAATVGSQLVVEPVMPNEATAAEFVGVPTAASTVAEIADRVTHDMVHGLTIAGENISQLPMPRAHDAWEPLDAA